MNHIETNQESWDRRTEIHFTSKMYDVDGFLKGKSSLKEIELAELADVEGKRLLHLQCHFGLDTLSWARRGGIVTGVDFSPTAIDKANELKARSGIDAEFVCSSIDDFRAERAGGYDIVFASYGTLCWLPDLGDWARVVSENLKVGGQLCLVEFHPIHDVISGYPYFHMPEPDVGEEGTYTENCPGEKMKLATWTHPISDVLNSLIESGIRIDRFNEYPFSPYNCFEDLEERESGRYCLSSSTHPSPLVFSVRGTKL